MSDTYKLDATQREIVGKHVKQYRRQGQIPAVVYGPTFEPVKLFINEAELRHVLAHAAGTHLIELSIDGTAVTALAREVQRHPIKGSILHVDFYHVAMDRVIRAEIPILVIGTSPAITRREAIVIQAMSTIQLEVLPADLPDHIEVDITGLQKVGDHILVSDLSLPDSVRVMVAQDELVLKLDYAEAVATEEDLLTAVPGSAEPEVLTAKKDEEAAEG
jgi:large subunit ribosomal protein L25